MIHQTRDSVAIHALLHRDFPGLDFTEVLNEPLHVVLVDGESGAIFAWRGPGVYEVHLFFAVRGRTAIDLFADMLDFMRLKGARMFWGAVPVADRRTRMFVRLCGWKSLGLKEMRDGMKELFVMEDAPCRH